MIITSSIATVGYGHGQTTGKRVYDETYFTNLEAMRWTWAYCIGKTKAEQAAWAFAKANGMALTTIHPGAIIGPALDDDASISIGLVTGLLDGTHPGDALATAFRSSTCATSPRSTSPRSRIPKPIGERYLATAEYMPFPKVADILREAYPDRKITIRIVPDWIIRLLAQFGGPTRQIINDIGNEKHLRRPQGRAPARPAIHPGETVDPRHRRERDPAQPAVPKGGKLRMS